MYQRVLGTRVRSAVAVLMAAAVTAFGGGVALADNFVNDIQTIGDRTITEGGSTAIRYKVNGSGNDGCNAANGTPLRVTINRPAAVTASASNLTFTDCYEWQEVTFSSSVVGSHNITHSLADAGAGDANAYQNQANFTLIVGAAPVTNTAPTLSLPANITAEATSSDGAAVEYSATASDTQDGSLTPSCNRASGSTFALGATTVNCSVTDSGNLSASGSFTVTVTDTTAPTFSGVPGNQDLEATGPGGATASWTAPSASDAVDGSVAVTCDSTSGSTFSIGTTTVTCSASDSRNNSDSRSFTINVADTTAPAITGTPDNAVIEATSAAGATHTWTAPTASDLVDGSRDVGCSPASGSTFALDETTTVTCSASDTRNNTAESGFTVQVLDTTAPTLTIPSSLTLNSTSAAGATGTFTVSATDAVDGSVTPTCSAQSGDTFAIGITTVTCSATDAHNNTSDSETFTVQVVYNFTGFLRPVDNGGVLNVAKAGSSIPVKFKLGGNQGLDIWWNSTAPSSASMACTSATTDQVEELTASASSSLNYDTTADQYNYVWKTNSTWAGSCRQLVVKLKDGTTHRANFKFTK